jgi:drug/metabolite transporter (DMT)-like permease
LALPLLLLLANAGFQILTSHMFEAEDSITTHFYTGWIVMVLSPLMLPFVRQMPADGMVWLQLLLMGLMGSVGHFFLILAYGHTRPPRSPLTCTLKLVSVS